MKKHFLGALILFFIIHMVYSQDNSSPVMQMDDAVAALAENIHAKLIEKNAQKVTLGQFTYRGAAVPFVYYWTNQLTEVLTNMPARPYAILSAGAAGADFTVSGEIVEVTNIVRIYTRLVRLGDRSVEAAFNSNFERTAAIAAMLVIPASGGESSSTDDYEPDSWENPVACEPGIDDNAPLINRTLSEGDEDFFLIIAQSDGRLVAETTGSIDTYMHLYDYETQEEVATNDDGGSGSNARIRHEVQAGLRYIAKVRGYNRSTSGAYSFRAYISAPREGSSSWGNPLLPAIGDDEDARVIERSFDSENEEDFFLLTPERDGRLIMETTGSLDTLMYFYDAETREELADDDDGGESYNARLRYSVRGGGRYMLKITTYDGDTGDYGLRVYLTGGNMSPADEFEVDDDPSQAAQLELRARQQHTFHSENDVDWVKFNIIDSGDYIIRARGVTSNRLDTYIELFDSDFNSIDEDDDGGSNRDSRLSLHLESGLYYLKVWCLDDEPNQPYTISVEKD